MSEEKKPEHGIIIPTAMVGEKSVKNDGGAFAKMIADSVVEGKRQAAIQAIKTAQNANSEQREQLDLPKPVSRKQRRAEARTLRKLANQSEAEREELKRLLTIKAKEAGLPFQVLIQRMMDSGKANLVEMAKIVRRIK